MPKITQDKFIQSDLYSAQITQIRSHLDQGISLVKEIDDALSKSPDYHYLPGGSSGYITV